MKIKLQITDIILLLVAIGIFGILTYQVITATSINESIKNICFAFGTILFGIKGYELNKLIRKEKGQATLNFFEYYEEELDMLITKRRFNFLLFLPITLKYSRKELTKQKLRVNLLTYGMYVFLFLSIFL